MLDWLVEPLSYGFMWRGLLAAIMVGTICSVLGTYVILQGMAFFGDALAHNHQSREPGNALRAFRSAAIAVKKEETVELVFEFIFVVIIFRLRGDRDSR